MHFIRADQQQIYETNISQNFISPNLFGPDSIRRSIFYENCKQNLLIIGLSDDFLHELSKSQIIAKVSATIFKYLTFIEERKLYILKIGKKSLKKVVAAT